MCDLDRDKFIRVPSEDVGEDLDDRPLTQSTQSTSSSASSTTTNNNNNVNTTNSSSTTTTTTTSTTTTSNTIVMNNINAIDNEDTNWRKMTPLSTLRSRLQALAKTLGNKCTFCCCCFVVVLDFQLFLFRAPHAFDRAVALTCMQVCLLCETLTYYVNLYFSIL